MLQSQLEYSLTLSFMLTPTCAAQEIETECLKPDSPVLQEIGLALLKNISSFRGLTYVLLHDIR